MFLFGLGKLLYGTYALPITVHRALLQQDPRRSPKGYISLTDTPPVVILIINAIAVLSEDRFLARIGWGRTQHDAGFGASADNASIKAKSVNLIASVRTVMRIPLIAINTIIIMYELILG
ncbi:hypothetical protein AJ80_01062 [Polytolypa hystricis UAMH7299]|uniref:Yos1-like protein n=1 Tax=Polytolypa hystricis (strain UAMH7299) TaxID=1447883 RepID=A0A2B7Z1S1_POLH7|nr:hypothetical protein AJ80_01062 [Polytolypa hystricis UAMH7299]